MGLIQFSDLAELVQELPAGHMVRVAVLEITEGLDTRLGVRLVSIGVHVRAFAANGHILACYVPTAMLQMVGDTCLNDPGGAAGTYEAAWQQARDPRAAHADCVADRVRECLAGRGFDVRPGVIDVGAARPLAWGWREDSGGE